MAVTQRSFATAQTRVSFNMKRLGVDPRGGHPVFASSQLLANSNKPSTSPIMPPSGRDNIKIDARSQPAINIPTLQTRKRTRTSDSSDSESSSSSSRSSSSSSSSSSITRRRRAGRLRRRIARKRRSSNRSDSSSSSSSSKSRSTSLTKPAAPKKNDILWETLSQTKDRSRSRRNSSSESSVSVSKIRNYLSDERSTRSRSSLSPPLTRPRLRSRSSRSSSSNRRSRSRSRKSKSRTSDSSLPEPIKRRAFTPESSPDFRARRRITSSRKPPAPLHPRNASPLSSSSYSTYRYGKPGRLRSRWTSDSSSSRSRSRSNF